MSAFDVAGGVLMIAGSLLTLLAALGLHRFPDIFARMHAATKPATLGLVLLLVGAIVMVGQVAVALRFGLVAGLAFITAPVASHMVGRAAYRAGAELGPDTVLDELADTENPQGPDPDRKGGAAAGA